MLGERITDLRKDKGLLQKDLAILLLVSVHTISNYENNKTEPDDEMKIMIADFFNVSVEYLLGTTNNPTPLQNTNQINISKALPKEAVLEINQFIKYIESKYNDK